MYQKTTQEYFLIVLTIDCSMVFCLFHIVVHTDFVFNFSCRYQPVFVAHAAVFIVDLCC